MTQVNLSIDELERRLQQNEAEKAQLAAALAMRLQAPNRQPPGSPQMMETQPTVACDDWRMRSLEVLAVDPLAQLEQKQKKQQASDEEHGRISELVASNCGRILANQVAELLMDTPLSLQEVALLYQYKHGKSLDGELATHNLRLDAVLSSSPLFLLAKGKVSLREKSSRPPAPWAAKEPPPPPPPGLGAPPGLDAPPAPPGLGKPEEKDCWDDLLSIVRAPSSSGDKKEPKKKTWNLDLVKSEAPCDAAFPALAKPKAAARAPPSCPPPAIHELEQERALREKEQEREEAASRAKEALAALARRAEDEKERQRKLAAEQQAEAERMAAEAMALAEAARREEEKQAEAERQAQAEAKEAAAKEAAAKEAAAKEAAAKEATAKEAAAKEAVAKEAAAKEAEAKEAAAKEAEAEEAERQAEERRRKTPEPGEVQLRVRLEKLDKLGLELQPSARGLVILGIKADLGAARHNKHFPSQALRAGDTLLEANGQSDPQAMINVLASRATVVQLSVARSAASAQAQEAEAREQKEQKQAQKQKLTKRDEAALLQQAQREATQERLVNLVAKVPDFNAGTYIADAVESVQNLPTNLLGSFAALSEAGGPTPRARQGAQAAYMTLIVLLIAGVQQHGLILSAVLTAGAYVALLSRFLLCLRVHALQSCAGLSPSAAALDVWFLATRLLATCAKNGYIPVDSTGDFAYQLGDGLSLACAVYLVYAMRGPLAASRDKDDPRLPATWQMVLACGVLACFCHPSLNDSPCWDALWMTSCWLETVALFPQFLLREQLKKKDRISESVTRPILVASCCGRSCSLLFWAMGWQELTTPGWLLNVPGFAVMASNMLQVSLSLEIAHTFQRDTARAAQKAGRLVSKQKAKAFPGVKATGAFR